MKIPLLYGLYEYLTDSPPKMAANLMDILTSGNYVYRRTGILEFTAELLLGRHVDDDWKEWRDFLNETLDNFIRSTNRLRSSFHQN